MNLSTFLASSHTLKGSEPLCFGPLCSGLPKTSADNATALSLFASTLGKAINLAFIVGGLFMLFFLLWGALDWVMSEGEKEKLQKAQHKIRNAVIGLLIMVASVTLFGAISGDILGVIKNTPDGWIFEFPTLGQ